MKVRIIQDSCGDFDVQVRNWWWLFWRTVRVGLNEASAIEAGRRLKNPMIVYFE